MINCVDQLDCKMPPVRRAGTLDLARGAELPDLVDESKRRPTEIEAADDVDFETFLARNFA